MKKLNTVIIILATFLLCVNVVFSQQRQQQPNRKPPPQKTESPQQRMNKKLEEENDALQRSINSRQFIKDSIDAELRNSRNELREIKDSLKRFQDSLKELQDDEKKLRKRIYNLKSALENKGSIEGDFLIQPDRDICEPGILTAETRQRMLNFVNLVRSHHKVAPLTLCPEGGIYAQAAAFSIATTGILSHGKTSGKCCTPESNKGRKESNISSGSSLESIIIGLLIDDGNIFTLNEVGHRLDILSPLYSTGAYGTAASGCRGRYRCSGGGLISKGGAAFRGGGLHSILRRNAEGGRFIIEKPMPMNTRCKNDFIAYPYENYPSEWVNKNFYLSFSILPRVASYYFNYRANVNFTDTKIRITDSKGNSLPVNDIHFFYGFNKQNITWKTAGLKDNEQYNVRITGTVVNGKTKNYNYWFRLVKN